ncbi:MAG: DHH family phosphoesterase, partial [Candidatus Roizmanbacteria bacterium]
MTKDVSLTRLVTLVEEKNSFAICIPQKASVDTVATATSLYLLLSKLGKSVALVSDEKPAPEVQLFATDKFGQTFINDGNVLEITIPTKEGIEDINYRPLEDGKLKLVVIPRENAERINFKDISFAYSGGKAEVVIAIDCAKLDTLGKIYEDNKAKFTDVEIVNIDRKFNNTQFGSVNIVNQQISSLSEIILQLIEEAKYGLDGEVATNLYSGIVYATNNFSAYSVSANTLEAAAKLLRSGAQKRPYVKKQDGMGGLGGALGGANPFNPFGAGNGAFPPLGGANPAAPSTFPPLGGAG